MCAVLLYRLYIELHIFRAPPPPPLPHQPGYLRNRQFDRILDKNAFLDISAYHRISSNSPLMARLVRLFTPHGTQVIYI